MEEHLSTFKGLPTSVKLKMLVEMGRVAPPMVLSVAHMKQQFTREAISRVIKPDPEKISLLISLAEMGFRLCICSNCVRESVDLLCGASRLADFVEFTLSTADAKPKPDPAMYLKAAEMFGVDPRMMIVVEDGEAGKRSARDAGCQLIEVTGPHEVTGGLLLPRIVAVMNGAGT